MILIYPASTSKIIPSPNNSFFNFKKNRPIHFLPTLIHDIFECLARSSEVLLTVAALCSVARRRGLPVLRERLHCLQRRFPQLLQGKEEDEPQPDENLHM